MADLSHAHAYRFTPMRDKPTCPFGLKRIGTIHSPEYHTGISLNHCARCRMLIAMFMGKVVWAMPVPPAAIYREEEEPSHAGFTAD